MRERTNTARKQLNQDLIRQCPDPRGSNLRLSGQNTLSQGPYRPTSKDGDPVQSKDRESRTQRSLEETRSEHTSETKKTHYRMRNRNDRKEGEVHDKNAV